ncbi:hypothetical protein DFA_00667 [Cavenderia fasciculata]|uniref:THH1/TOM1/TOM3 domain-containing protein n=1 Tax=Cavenderia fasciculata TaxID=261658 RepID=F4PT66_CACFS|nr:uncharacterized protein DFA_00667 [Cavenderia fasciculata]EGG20802.1 hypothetical protein DFA_00667 [Cavenderia fasciculata]|eukprot:XP_004358652.1 hypothetical protein DFA_00667 [Cavenderia fasciculata]
MTGVSQPSLESSNLPTYYRFYASPDSCTGYRMRINQNQSTVYVLANYEPFTRIDTPSRVRLSRESEMTITFCPTDEVIYQYSYQTHYPFGTIFFIVINEGNLNSTYDIIIEPIPIDPRLPDTDIPACVRADPTIPCVRDGRLIEGYSVEPTLDFSYTIYNCQNVSANILSVNVDVDVYIWIDQPPPVSGETTGYYFDSSYSVDETFTLSLCPDEGKTNKTLFIRFLQPDNGQMQINAVIKSNAIIKAVELSSLPTLAGSWMLGGSSYLVDSNNITLRCDNYDLDCTEYLPTAPRTYINPFYPVPSVFTEQGLGLRQFNDIVLYENASLPLKNAFQFGLMISLSYNGFTMQFRVPDEIGELTIVFLGRLVDSQGRPLTGPYKVTRRTDPVCVYDEFKKIDALQNVILEETDITTSLRYEYDLLIYSDPYYYCQQDVMSMITFATSQYTLENSSRCAATSDMATYLADPCCSIYASFSGTCEPHNTTLSLLTLQSIDSQRVNDTCTFASCANSVLANYAQTLQTAEQNPCDFAQEQQDSIEDELYTVFRACHASVIPAANCTQDSDCTSFGTGSYCNYRRGECNVPANYIERSFVGCIVEAMPISIMNEVVTMFELDDIRSDKDAIAEFLHTQNQANDCVSYYGVNYWSRYVYEYTVDQFAQGSAFPSVYGLDRSAGITHYDATMRGGFIYKWISWFSSKDLCSRYVKCDWLGADGTLDTTTYNDLVAECQDSPSRPTGFCGDCSTDPTRNCIVAPGATQSNCATNHVCYFETFNPALFHDPANYYPIVTDPNQCAQQYGSCSVPCGYECATPNSCVIQLAPDELQCPQFNGPFDAVTSVNYGSSIYCVFSGAFTAAQCTQSAGNLTQRFQTCGSLSASQCTTCGDASFPVCGCTVTPVECATQAQCLAQKGKCSDSYYFETKIAAYPAVYPKCLVPYGKSDILAATPQCTEPDQQDSPMGCYSGNLADTAAAYCQGHGGSVWNMATTQAQCTAYGYGCKGYDRSQNAILPSTLRFNEKDESQCTAEGDQWIPKFDWTPAVWTPAKASQLSWQTTRGIVPYTNYSSALSFEKFFGIFETATERLQSIVYKSQLLCRVSTSKNALESLTCSCFNDESNDRCFDSIESSSNTILNPCNGITTTNFLNNHATVQFVADSIAPDTCVLVGIADLYSDQFIAKRVFALASSFVTYIPPEDYSVYNGAGAVVGRVISDGVSLRIFDEGVQSIDICITQTLKYDVDQYPTIDFALIDPDSGSITAFGCTFNGSIVPPIDPSETTNPTGDKNNNNQKCCRVPKPESIGTNDYIMIARTDDWETAPFQPFSDSDTRMIHTLAALFLILTVFGFAQLLHFSYCFFIKKEPYKVVYLLFFFLFCFSLIRCIYFFILPSNQLPSGPNVGEYILVVLPTFLYFTSFTIVITIWYILSNTNITMYQNVFKVINKLILVSNSVLYLFFVIIVLVFNFTNENDPPTCGGRKVTSFSNTTPQNVVSILYAVIQALLSLVIGIAFIYFGLKIYRQFSAIHAKDSQQSTQKAKTFTMAAICSIGFVLHCIFIIVLVSVSPSNINFSFAGLLITELVPVATLFITYNQIPLSMPKFVSKTIKISGTTSQFTSGGSGNSGNSGIHLRESVARGRHHNSTSTRDYSGSTSGNSSISRETTNSSNGSNNNNNSSSSNSPIVYLDKK